MFDIEADDGGLLDNSNNDSGRFNEAKDLGWRPVNSAVLIHLIPLNEVGLGARRGFNSLSAPLDPTNKHCKLAALYPRRMKRLQHVVSAVPRMARWRYAHRDYYPWYAAKLVRGGSSEPHPSIVFILALPRTGSTVAKRYLGESESVMIAPYETYLEALQRSGRHPDQVVLDKATKNMKRIPAIERASGSAAWFLGLVRDPRDELCSLLETDRHPEVPRDELFWDYWSFWYGRLLRSLELLGKRGHRSALIRYEDLATDPMRIKADFLYWIGREAGAVSERYQSSVPEIADGIDKSEDWKAHLHESVHTASIGRWKTSPSDTQELLGAWRTVPRARQLMKKLGYLPDLSTNSRGLAKFPLSRIS